MIFRDFQNDLARSLGFLSRLPMPARYFEGYDGSLTRAVRAFPLAGSLIALPPAALLAILLALKLEPMVAAVVTLVALTLITGALHEDGLGDTADGVGGGSNRRRALEIMRDSRIGSYGASVMILSYLLRASAIAAIASALTPVSTAWVIIAIGALSRAALVWHWSSMLPARSDGVAVSAGAPDANSVWFGLATALAIGLALIWPTAGLAAALAAFAAAGLATWLLSRYIKSRLGGYTGDTIGAAQQCAEMAALVALALMT